MIHARRLVGCIALLGMGYGAAVLDSLTAKQVRVDARNFWSIAFSYTKNGETAFEVKPDGRINFGPAYTERAMQEFFQGLRDTIKFQRQMERSAPECVSVIFRDGAGNMHGEIRP